MPIKKDFIGIDANVAQQGRGGAFASHINGHANSIDCSVPFDLLGVSDTLGPLLGPNLRDPAAIRRIGVPAMIAATYTDWYIGLGLAFAIIVVVVIIVAIILTMAARIADQASQADAGVDVVRAQSVSLSDGVDRVNDSAVRILHMARALRKMAVGK